MNAKLIFSLFLVISMLTLTACNQVVVDATPGSGLPNPASVFCEENNGTLELRTDEAGNVTGVCVFADGSQCEEWAYSRGECKPGDSLADDTPEGWKTFENDELGYSFQYPADCSLLMNDDPSDGLTIIGPEQDGERWPMISIAHPRFHQDFRLPTGTDLSLWLLEHNLLGAERLVDVDLAETRAVHLHHDRSPQSYAFDQYYFAKGDQLYVITINHTGDLQDWELYGRFLESIHFEL
jgi:putative hemolysin